MKKISLTMLTSNGHKKSMEFNYNSWSDKRHFRHQHKYYSLLGWETLNINVVI